MIAVRVADDRRLHVVASPAYVARRGKPLKPPDLHNHNCIRFRLAQGEFVPWEFVVDGKVVEIQVEGSVIVNDPDLLHTAALEGLGIIFTMEEYVRPMIDEGKLVSLLDDFAQPPTDGFFLFYPSRRQNSAALQAFIEFLRKEWKASGKK
jgi:DNA-binding transcriptional LysR family regulator